MQRRALLAIATVLVGAGVGVSTASAAPSASRIFCPVFPDPTVQTVAHTVCTHTPH